MSFRPVEERSPQSEIKDSQLPKAHQAEGRGTVWWVLVWVGAGLGGSLVGGVVSLLTALIRGQPQEGPCDHFPGVRGVNPLVGAKLGLLL